MENDQRTYFKKRQRDAATVLELTDHRTAAQDRKIRKQPKQLKMFQSRVAGEVLLSDLASAPLMDAAARFFVDLHESSNILILSSTRRGAALLLSLLAEAICAIWCLIDSSINQWLHWLPTERKRKL